MEAPLRGKLLVALPPLADPNFDRSVVLVLEHGAEEGALGVILNRPSATDVEGAVPGWDRFAVEPSVVFVGGPVQPGAAIALAEGAPFAADEVDELAVVDPADGWAPLFDRLATVDLNRDPDDLQAAVEKLRIFSGYAGWGPGQLEDEIEAGAWLAVESLPDDPLTADPENLWSRVLRRQGGRLAWLANFPPDPSMN